VSAISAAYIFCSIVIWRDICAAWCFRSCKLSCRGVECVLLHFYNAQPYTQGCSGTGTHGNGVPTLFSRFVLRCRWSCFKMAIFWMRSHTFFARTTSLLILCFCSCELRWRNTECILLPYFNALPDIFAVMNFSVLALSAVFWSGLITWSAVHLCSLQ